MKLRFTALWFVLILSLLCTTTASAQNPVQLENKKPGTSAWTITKYASSHQIEGYANLTSVNRGGQIEFFVNTIDPTYSIQIFRMGWYSGAGARQITTISQLAGKEQPACPSDATTGLMECNWENPYVLQIPDDTADPTDWCSGVYLAKLISSSGWESYIVFDVRDDARASNYLFQNSVNTYEAYNNWGGLSLYGYNSTNSNPARKVSFNRPYAAWDGAGQFMDWEYPMVRFLEGEGGQAYDVTYATDVDIDGNGSLLLSHKADIIVGHGEYWTYNDRANVQAALAQGVSLGFFSANTCYWQVRYENSLAGNTPDRTVVGYKGYALTEDPDYIDGNTSEYPYVTTNWRSTPVNRPEDALIGVLYANVVSTGDVVVYNASNWVFNNTGLQNGSHITNVLGDEVDGEGGETPPGTVLLSHSPYTIPSSKITYYADMTVYTAPSGATVFAAGTMTWSWGLDNWSSEQASTAFSAVSTAAQQMTRNILAHFLTNSSSSTITLLPGALAFQSQPEGTTSGAQSVTVTNLGSAALKITAAPAISGANSGDFAIASGASCTNGASIATNASCIVNITFKPTVNGTESATLTITDSDASSPQTVTLTGTGSPAAAPAVGIAPTSLTFTAQLVGSSSSPTPITVTNTGNATLSISGVTVSGAQAKEFSVGSSTCGQSIAVGANCKIPVSFTPAAAGSRTAALTITDNTIAGTQTLILSGTGSDFTLSVNSTAETINAGQTATYNMTVSPVAFTGEVAFTCSGAPNGATCSIAPEPISLSGSTPSQVVVTIATTARSSFPAIPFDGQKGLWLGALAAILLASLGFAIQGNRRLKPSLVLMTVLLIACLGCGGTANNRQATNTNNPQNAGPGGTPAGTSTVTVTATSSSTVHTLPLTLTVE